MVVGRDKDDLIKIINATATDGTQTAIGVIASDVNATKAVIITRIAMFADHAVVWPTVRALNKTALWVRSQTVKQVGEEKQIPKKQ